ncbi:MAG: methenyltetrahydrofolate cyclohydrolase [Clostridiales bacterium]|nr:methenyltetrahydrofolate cyclohydrolase [Clostridiales bacterium]
MLKNLDLNAFLAETASKAPVPGGGSVAALSAALAAALAAMVANLTIGKKKYEAVSEEMAEKAKMLEEKVVVFQNYIDEDAKAFDAFMQAMKLPKETDEEKALRAETLQKELKHAAEVPLSLAKETAELFDIILWLLENGNANAKSDAAVAGMMARTAVLSALYNVKINLESIQDEPYAAQMRSELEAIKETALNKEQVLLGQYML